MKTARFHNERISPCFPQFIPVVSDVIDRSPKSVEAVETSEKKKKQI